MGKVFGTNGVMGVAISELSTEAAMLIGRATAFTLEKNTGKKPKILIAKDTRISCNVLESALVAGICSIGADVLAVGILPTPAAAFLTVKYGADAAIVISASHNSFEYNGFKIFSALGRAISTEVEDEIERLVFTAQDEMMPTAGITPGRVYFEKNAEWDYVRHLLKSVNRDLSRMRIVVDCANGAAFGCSEKFFKGLGANVIFINNAPNGVNINLDCGSTCFESLKNAVVANKAHAGIAFDGDADRVIMVDENGNVVDGDKLIAILAFDMKSERKLLSNTCVVTQMTNLGFFKWAKENGIVVSTASKVGGKYVCERMVNDGYNLGGEQSGHIILSDYAPTGDGELTAAKILEIMAKTGIKLSELSNIFKPYPQILLNIRLRPECRGVWENVPEITEMIEFCAEKLSSDGRIFVRESGTEPYLRIMAEGRDEEAIYQYANAIASVAKDHLGEI